MMNISIELTAVIGAAIVFTIWLSGLGFSNRQMKVDLVNFKKEIKEKFHELKNEHDALAVELRDEVKEMNATLHRIEGKLDN